MAAVKALEAQQVARSSSGLDQNQVSCCMTG
jgi:hypothetical protein